MWEKLADASHPIWKLLRYVVTGIVVAGICATLYRCGFDPKDVVLILGVIGSMVGFDVVKNATVASLNHDK